jgi:endonuclease-3
MLGPMAPSTSRPASRSPTRVRLEAPAPAEVLDRLERTFPDATTELAFRTPFELLVATILSAQSTDERVNQVTPALFARYATPAALAAADPHELETLIKSTGFFRQKAHAIRAASARLVEEHDGQVPPRMEALVELPGVGRKTANVVLGHALGVPGLPVDRHVLRVATRIGLAHADTPEAVEQQLCAALPPERWTRLSDCLILHGRRVCRPRPQCPRCVLADLCVFYRSGAAAIASPTTAARGVGRATRSRTPAHTTSRTPPAARRRKP